VRLGIAHETTVDLAISGSRTWQLARVLGFADDRRVSVVTIADLFIARRRISPIDSFHPNADAYERIARRVAEAM
jgi:lysophospholipase L1-like esterase